MELFAEITRRKDRFQTTKGLLSIEDVWDLPLTAVRGPNLDDLAKALKKELTAASDESFVQKRSDKAKDLERKFEAVLFIIKTKLEEREAAKLRREKAQRKELIMRLLEEKEMEDLKGKSTAELKKMLEDM